MVQAIRVSQSWFTTASLGQKIIPISNQIFQVPDSEFTIREPREDNFCSLRTILQVIPRRLRDDPTLERQMLGIEVMIMRLSHCAAHSITNFHAGKTNQELEVQ